MPDVTSNERAASAKATASGVNGSASGVKATANGSAKAGTKDSTANDSTGEDHKRKKLVRKQKPPNPLKYQIWLFGHLACIVFGTISFTFQIFWLPNKFYINSICYRLSLLGSIGALLATVSHKFGLSYLPPTSTLIAQQNFQFVVLAIAWLFTFKSIFKIIPFYLIAVLQIAQHKKIDAVLKQQLFLASLIAYNELVFIVYLVLRTLAFRGTSGFQLILFLLFYWLRILYNPETGNLFEVIIERLDGKVKNVKNEKVVYYWNKTKTIVQNKAEAEELS